MATPGQGRVERRLAAILAADVAGYSRLTGLDEEGTHAQLQDHLRSLVDPKIAEHRGRVVKNTGDGLLAEFSSVVDAVRCAVDVQRGMAERNAKTPQERRIEFRIGINVGDIIIDRGDIFGDGVNVAARLEAVAEPGGICVSSRVQEDVQSKLQITFENAGEQQLKNIARPVRVYHIRLTGAAPSSRPALPLPDKPSITVLPFQNMSDDPEQDYFADGVVQEIITALSRFRYLFVIARNSSFTYKGRVVDVKQVGRELGVRYLLEGSVRKAVNRVRITGQLIDAFTGATLWADRFEGELPNIFDLQDQVAEKVVSAIAPRVFQAEIERSKRKPTENLDAYDHYLRAFASLRNWTRDVEANSQALRLFYKAIELDPDFAAAYGGTAGCYIERKTNGWMVDGAQETTEATRVARRAVELGKDDAGTLSVGGFTLAYVAHELEAGANYTEQAIMLNPNFAAAWHFGGLLKAFLGEPEVAIERVQRAMRLSPLDPLMPIFQLAIAFAHFIAGRYDEAIVWAHKAMQEQPNRLGALRLLAASNALTGQLQQAQTAIARLRQLDPSQRVSNLKNVLSLRRPEDLARFEDGLRKAGLPE